MYWIAQSPLCKPHKKPVFMRITQSLLSKVKSTLTVYTKTLFTHDYNWFNSNFNRKNNSNYTYTENFSWKWEITFSWQFRDEWNWWTPTSISYSWDITEVSKTLDNYHSYSTTVKINWTWSISVSWTKYNWYSRASWTTSNATYKFQIPWISTSENRWPIRDIFNIWELGGYTSFWRHIDWTWITWS